jgi:hypothetical protein
MLYLRTCIGRRADIERLRRAGPIIRAIDAELTCLAKLGSFPEAREGFGDTLIEAITRSASAAAKLADAKAAEARQRDERDAINVDESLLKRADEIDLLAVELGAYRTAMRDLPRVQADVDGADAELKDFAVRLGFSDAEVLMPTGMQAWRIQFEALLDQRHALRQRQSEAELRSQQIVAARPAFVALGAELDLRCWMPAGQCGPDHSPPTLLAILKFQKLIPSLGRGRRAAERR